CKQEQRAMQDGGLDGAGAQRADNLGVGMTGERRAPWAHYLGRHRQSNRQRRSPHKPLTSPLQAPYKAGSTAVCAVSSAKLPATNSLTSLPPRRVSQTDWCGEGKASSKVKKGQQARSDRMNSSSSRTPSASAGKAKR